MRQLILPKICFDISKWTTIKFKKFSLGKIRPAREKKYTKIIPEFSYKKQYIKNNFEEGELKKVIPIFYQLLRFGSKVAREKKYGLYNGFTTITYISGDFLLLLHQRLDRWTFESNFFVFIFIIYSFYNELSGFF